MVIDKRLIPLFEKINFAERYIDLCRKYNNFESHLPHCDISLVETFYKKMGLSPKYLKKEKFFKVEELVGEFKIQFKTVPKDGFVQFLFNVNKGNEKLKIGMGMWEVITRSLKGVVVRKPIYTSEEELKEILKTAIELYQDFKMELENQSD